MSKAEKAGWTLMFFFAGDNGLSPLVVSELKAIKDAGPQKDVNVLVYFDPNELGAPTRLYDINGKRKKEKKEKEEKQELNSETTVIGDGGNSFVHDLEDDSINLGAVEGDTNESRERPALLAIREALRRPDELKARDALRIFLEFCRQEYSAKHYILFLFGHGLIVANDAFLPDDNPVSSITLKNLGTILTDFTKEVTDEDGGVLEMLALHSCSMSAIEVAYQLKGTAKLMMASQGLSYVNSWPYRKLLRTIFRTINGAPGVNVKLLMENLYFLTLFNAKDFNLCGISSDLTLCNLAPKNFEDLTGKLQTLVAKLKKGLEDSALEDKSPANELGKRIKELILLAHWEAQSYWGESYTDLHDFCRCLSERCGENDGLKDLRAACEAVRQKLTPLSESEEEAKSEEEEAARREERFKELIIHSNAIGSQYQYSHGLSIYFPWSQPVEAEVEELPAAERQAVQMIREAKDLAGKLQVAGDFFQKNPKSSLCSRIGSLLDEDEEVKGVLKRYQTDYTFTADLKEHSWLEFLKVYFKTTQRKHTRAQEDAPTIQGNEEERKVQGNGAGGQAAASSGASAIGSPIFVLEPDKPSPSAGSGCNCPSIKNYPKEIMPRKVFGKWKLNTDKCSLTRGAKKLPARLVEQKTQAS